MPNPNNCPQCGGGPVTWKCTCEPMWRPSAVVLDDGRPAEYRVGWFESSSNPRKRVRYLFEGAGIAEAEKHHSFIAWCDTRAASLQPAAQTALDETGVIERLTHHIADKRNTAFSRSTMQDAMTLIGELTQPPHPIVAQAEAKVGEERGLTVTPAMVKAAMPWLTSLHHMRKTDKESNVEEAIRAALTAAQPASGGDRG